MTDTRSATTEVLSSLPPSKDEIDTVVATLSTRGNWSTKELLSDRTFMDGFTMNRNSIRQSLSMAAKWRNVGYNPFHPDADGFTALHRAASKGDDALVKALLSTYEGDVLDFASTATSKQGQTALHLACKGGHHTTANVLLTAGKSLLSCVDRHGNTPLHFAATSSAPQALALLEWLISYVPLDYLSKPNNHGLSPVAAHVAVTTNDSASVLRLFLERDIDPNTVVRGENTLLHVCVDRKLFNMAGCLVEFGAALNLPDTRGILVTDLLPDRDLAAVVKYASQPQEWVSLIRKKCMSCTSKFHLFRRRHHCRLCGRVLCGACTKYKRSLNDAVAAKVRVCHVCVTVTRSQKAKSGSMTDVTTESDDVSIAMMV
ncbi:hypothetical protein H257_03099 [Aphanomyces astaci]|uniref:FYVE-type domain-containing protein n=2 Tax=Aphanomyces astaci TaxID=112090 RepID=W4H2D6_APHAT|nr:hypothetical protein H257_03099 [Aphanomyces astaci]ETV85333.1 hypothetical protein H257_03099 [Aphanomyces astaci]RHY91357.1 hypothetical protein DYB35_007912 [Aphanomyces astaci]RHZ10190.1 hypothetical protein DYB37_003630 [Aphanomyces astaci]RQM19146.1 hypothetical protein B5M09_001426 [Aphanomyces astaci]|eukprot:XP_009825351.1 hypothetical protein H257_03099 [Aphanomyces astaci]